LQHIPLARVWLAECKLKDMEAGSQHRRPDDHNGFTEGDFYDEFNVRTDANPDDCG
jgi:hypothetical protein